MLYRSSPLLVELPVVNPGFVVPRVVVPLTDDPVLVPLVADPPVDVPALVEPVPVCATANGLADISAAANPRVTNFMMGFLSGEKGKTAASGQCSCADINWV